MPLLTLDNAELAYGDVALLHQTSLVLEDNERVALIGRNGSGKSSLLRALAGQTQLDDGTIWRAPSSKIAYVPQEPDFELNQNIYAAVSAGLGQVAQTLQAYHQAIHNLHTNDPQQLAELERLQHELEHHDAWRAHMHIERCISDLKLDPDVQIASLSGGGIKRVALMRALVMQPDVLLLDEPTNHLDIQAITWLEDLIRAFKGSVVVITHDRSFMDNVATRIIELDRGKLRSYPGSFAAYQKRKAEELENEAKQAAEFDKFLAQEEVWIRKGVEARRTRNEGRVRRLEQLRIQRAQRREQLGQVNLQLDSGASSGKLVVEMHDASKRFGERIVVDQFSTRILRGARIGLIGPNGAGKTTLLKLILGELAPDSGTVRQGTKQSIAYFDQFRTQLAPDAPLTDVISPGSDYVEIGGARKHVIGYLEDFLFSPQRARSPVKSLSGGERNRLLLARLFAQPANIVVLDEPTNDLDIETLELLEALLQDYDGTLFLVSHDRTFLDNTVSQVIAYEGNGRWKEYAGGYSDWLRQRNETATSSAAEPQKSVRANKEDKTEKPNRANRLSYMEKRTLEQLPAQIETLEAEQTTLQTRLADPATYQGATQDIAPLHQRLAEIEEQLMQLLEQWETLEAKQNAS